jgi:hypothetical protein
MWKFAKIRPGPPFSATRVFKGGGIGGSASHEFPIGSMT